MKLIFCLMLLAVPLSGAGKSPARKSLAASTASILIGMERDWLQAGITKDVKTINRIIADDWVSVDFQGHTVTKAQAMSGLRAAPAATQSVGPGDMQVRVFGTTAIVQGRDSAGQYAWMDVFLKRNGRWQAVASQSTKVQK